MTTRRWTTADALVIGAILVTGGLWFAYGLFGPTAYASEETSPPVWFRWEVLGYLTVALAVVIGVFMPRLRGLIADAVLVAVVVGALGLGVALGGGSADGSIEGALAGFFAIALVVGASAWLSGVVVGALWRWAAARWPLPAQGRVSPSRRRAHRSGRFDLALLDDSGLDQSQRFGSVGTTGAVALVALVAFGLFGFMLFRLASGAGETSFSTSIQSTPTATVNVGLTEWGRARHSFLPGLGDRRVALRVVYVATEGEVTYSESDWVAHDTDGVTYQTVVWPNRRPLGSGVITEGGDRPRRFGWVAFVVPESTPRLDVTFQQGDDEPLYWTFDADGARSAVPTPTPALGT